MSDPPPGMVRVELGKGCTLVIPERVYLAGLKLGKTLRRRAAQIARGNPEALHPKMPSKAP